MTTDAELTDEQHMLAAAHERADAAVDAWLDEHSSGAYGTLRELVRDACAAVAKTVAEEAAVDAQALLATCDSQADQLEALARVVLDTPDEAAAAARDVLGASPRARLREMVYRDGHFSIELVGTWATRLFAETCGRQLANADGGHWNYVEMQLSTPAAGAMTLTLQRTSGQTPHQLRGVADAEATRLRTMLRMALALSRATACRTCRAARGDEHRAECPWAAIKTAAGAP